MKSNWFRLQTILDLRASTLENAQNNLALAQSKFDSANEALQEARQKVNAIAECICSGAAILTSAEFHATRQWHLYHTRQVEVHLLKVLECQKNVQQCLVQVVTASREHEVLARFREKSLKAAQAIEAKKAETLLDDQINSQRFQKARQNSGEYLAA